MSVGILLDHVIKNQGLKNDAALSRLLEVAPPVISKLRSGVLTLGSTMILAIHESTGIKVSEIRSIGCVPGPRNGIFS